ncbi:radical SAM protein [Chloroflexota bacterium]
MPYIAIHHLEKCAQCGICSQIVGCPGADESICIGCGACVLACPNQALELVEEPREREVTIEVNGRLVQVPERISVKEALTELGHPAATSHEEPGLFAPCEVGGCWNCAMEVDGTVKPTCRAIVTDGMTIKTTLPKEYVPRRIVTNFLEHMAGGVGTPWQSRTEGKVYIEAVCFVAGCNFRCPQCQNWAVTYKGTGTGLTPKEAAQRLTKLREGIGVNRLLISGGECTLNRAWLTQFVTELRELNPDSEARFHIDTNGSLLTHDYIDELVTAGMTDIGIDLKALETDTFMRITGLKDKDLAEKYKETAWEAVRYLVHNYSEKVFVGVGIPYNQSFVSVPEISRAGKRLLEIAPVIQVTLINYRNEFRSRIIVPGDDEMKMLRNLLKDIGLNTVLCQTIRGYIGP